MVGYVGYTIYVLLNGKMLAADWASTKTQAKERVSAIFARSVQEQKVVIAVSDKTGEVVSGLTNLHEGA